MTGAVAIDVTQVGIIVTVDDGVKVTDEEGFVITAGDGSEVTAGVGVEITPVNWFAGDYWSWS